MAVLAAEARVQRGARRRGARRDVMRHCFAATLDAMPDCRRRRILCRERLTRHIFSLRRPLRARATCRHAIIFV